jgi:hypothetical protein
MAKKTFKIGESCLHGIISVETSRNTVKIFLKDFYTKEVKEERVFSDTMSLVMYLGDVTSAYYADKVIDFIKTTDVSLTETSMW